MADHHRALPRIALLVLLAGSLGGCYSYARIPLDAAQPGEQLRLTVTRDGALDYMTFNETSDAAPSFVGMLEGEDRGALLVRIPLAQDPTQGPAARQIDQLIRVPTAEVLGVERRTVSGVKTAFMVAGSVAAGAAIVAGIINASGGRNGDNGDPPDLLFQLLRIPIG